jgi:hypothetical protein
MVGFEVSPDGVCVKCDEDDVIKCSQNELQVGVGRTPVDRFTVN